MSNELVPRRQVLVYNTIGQNEVVITTSAATWEQLQRDLHSQGVPFRDMKAVIGETQVTLESRGAQLPTTDFSLFLVPEKVKSGN
jgi:argininosuccinate lyase